MPRIEIIPKGHDPRTISPVIDLCHHCKVGLEEGQPVPDCFTHRFPGATVGSTDVEHPPYEWDAEAECWCCECPLDETDN